MASYAVKREAREGNAGSEEAVLPARMRQKLESYEEGVPTEPAANENDTEQIKRTPELALRACHAPDLVRQPGWQHGVVGLARDLRTLAVSSVVCCKADVQCNNII